LVTVTRLGIVIVKEKVVVELNGPIVWKPKNRIDSNRFELRIGMHCCAGVGSE